jgi:hypothetical protein
MTRDHMLGEELASLELFITEETFPDVASSSRSHLLDLPNGTLNLLSNKPHGILVASAHLLDLLLSIFLNLLEDSLHIGQFFIIGLRTQENSTSTKCQNSLIFILNAGIVIEGVHSAQI